MFWSILRIAVGVYVGLMFLLFLFQSRLVYFPTRQLEVTPANAGLDYEDVTFQAEDGVKLHGWFVPAEKAAGVVLLCHGNGGNISHRLETLRILHGLGLSTLIFDYRGYGTSAGRPGEKGTYMDAEAARRWLIDHKPAVASRIVLMGRSLGGAVAAHLARTHPPAGLVLESSFTSIPDIGARMYPFLPIRLLSRFDYDTRKYVGQVSCPVLVIHGTGDELVPFAHGQALFEAANEPKEFLELSGGHNDGFLSAGTLYTDRLGAFFDRCLGE